MKKESVKIALGYVLICLLWGSTWLAIRIGLESFTPFISAGIRFLIASAIIAFIVKLKKIPFPRDKQAMKVYFSIAIFSFVIGFGLVYWGEQYVNSGLASVLFGIYPISVFIFTKLMIGNEEIGIFKFISVIMGLIGVTVIFSDSLSNGSSNDAIGVLAILLSAIVQGWVAVYLKKYAKELNSFSMNLIPLFIAGIILLVLGFGFENYNFSSVTLDAVLSILYLAIFGTIFTFTTYYWLLKRMNVVILSLSSFITPIVALLLGWIFMDEILTKNNFIGSLLVLFGILFANLKGLKKYFSRRKAF